MTLATRVALLEARYQDDTVTDVPDPVDFARRTGFEPAPWQANVLRSSAPRTLLNCSRQAGKSTTTALLALHQALYVPESLILLIATHREQAGELFRKVAERYTAIGATVPPRAESALRLELENGSRVIALQAKEASVRGYSSASLLLIDEASRVPDALYYAVLPMLAVSGGRVVAMSTPFGKRGWWADAWHSDAPWERYEVPATRCPHLSPEFLEEAERSMGEWWFRQEFLCEFLDSQTQLFSTDEIARAFSRPIETWEL